MRNLWGVGAFIVVLAACAWAQPPRMFDWVRASDEFVQLGPMDFHAGRVYRPGSEGGDMHVIIHSKQPVTLTMVAAAEWNAAQTNPDAIANLEYRCIREHVTDTTYECHLPPHPMVLVIHDERTADRAIVRGIGVIVGKANAKQLLSPNEVRITYHAWQCVQNCIQPEYQWFRIVKEKYQVDSGAKLYSVVTPEYDGQRMWVKIKAPVPMTVAVLPSKLADQAYDKPDSLSATLSETACKQRGVQAMEFECKIDRADGPQSLFVVPDSPPRTRKKVEIEFQTVKCTANCELIANDTK